MSVYFSREYGRSSVLFENAECSGESENAIYVVFEEDHEEHCIPKSQIHKDSDIREYGDTGNLIITRWIAEKRGLVED